MTTYLIVETLVPWSMAALGFALGWVSRSGQVAAVRDVNASLRAQMRHAELSTSPTPPPWFRDDQ